MTVQLITYCDTIAEEKSLQDGRVGLGSQFEGRQSMKMGKTPAVRKQSVNSKWGWGYKTSRLPPSPSDSRLLLLLIVKIPHPPLKLSSTGNQTHGPLETFHIQTKALLSFLCDLSVTLNVRDIKPWFGLALEIDPSQFRWPLHEVSAVACCLLPTIHSLPSVCLCSQTCSGSLGTWLRASPTCHGTRSTSSSEPSAWPSCSCLSSW